MPKLISINPTGYFSYGIHLTVNLDGLGLVLLDGRNEDRGGTANGAGKTSLPNALTQIIFGKNPSGESGESIINEFLGKCFGRVVFEDDKGVLWRITETKKWRKTDKYPDEKLRGVDFGYTEPPSELANQGIRYSGTDVFLERWDGALWVDERSTNKKVGDTRLDLKATRKKILDIFGMNYDQFMSTAYLAQQQSMKFINGTHKERMEVFHDLGQLAQWDSRLKAVREQCTQEESEKLRLESKLNGLRAAGVSLTAPNPDQKVLLQTLISDLNTKISQCDSQITQLQSARVAWTAAIAQFESDTAATGKALRETALNKETTLSKLNQLALAYTNKCNEIRERPRDQRIAPLETEIAEAHGHVQVRRYDMEQLMTGAGKCPRCRTNVSHEHLARQRELLVVEIRTTEEKIHLRSEQLASLIEASDASVRHDLEVTSLEYLSAKSEIENAVNVIDMMIDTLQTQLENTGLARQKAGDDPQRRIDEVAQKRLLFLSEKTRYDEKARGWAEQQKKHDEFAELIKATEAQRLQHETAVRYLSALDKLFGDKGIKAFKLDNLLQRLNLLLFDYVNIITEDSVALWVTQYREKTDGEMTADIQIMVREGQKKEVPFALYSGGERQQIMLAFIGAFWQLASEYGAGVNSMFLDEVLGPMDDINAQKVFSFLEYLRSKGKSSIFVVTHNQSIKDQIRFDQTWTAVKKNHLTTLVAA